MLLYFFDHTYLRNLQIIYFPSKILRQNNLLAFIFVETRKWFILLSECAHKPWRFFWNKLNTIIFWSWVIYFIFVRLNIAKTIILTILCILQEPKDIKFKVWAFLWIEFIPSSFCWSVRNIFIFIPLLIEKGLSRLVMRKLVNFTPKMISWLILTSLMITWLHPIIVIMKERCLLSKLLQLLNFLFCDCLLLLIHYVWVILIIKVIWILMHS